MQDPRPVEPASPQDEPSEFFDSLKKGLLLGGVLLVLIVPPLRMAKAPKAPAEAPVASAPQQGEPLSPGQRPIPGVRLADFRGEDPSPDARLVANWVVHTSNAKQSAFVIIDKKDARVYVFSPDGRLQDSAPALLGSARGDDSFPGIGEK